MRRWFLSYHSPDQALAERLKAALRARDPEAAYSSRPRTCGPAGTGRQQLAAEIAEAAAFILLVGEKGLGPWQVLEYDEALDKRVKSPDFPIVLMLLEGNRRPACRSCASCIGSSPPIRRPRRRWRKLVEAAPAAASATRRVVALHLALSRARRDDGGGQRLLLRPGARDSRGAGALADGADRLPVLLGNSGVGKSSLAQAGVLAALEAPSLARDQVRGCGHQQPGRMRFATAAAGAFSRSGPAPSR